MSFFIAIINETVPYANSHVLFIIIHTMAQLCQSFNRYHLGSFLICMIFSIFESKYNTTHLGLITRKSHKTLQSLNRVAIKYTKNT
jgi:hypothetical protein